MSFKVDTNENLLISVLEKHFYFLVDHIFWQLNAFVMKIDQVLSCCAKVRRCVHKVIVFESIKTKYLN